LETARGQASARTAPEREGPPSVTPRFSLFIPVWNGAKWISGAIDSILARTYPEWELVIGDNASTDDLAVVISRYADARIRLHRWPTHTDLCENFNRTTLLARHEWVQLLGVDDRIAPHCLETTAARIQTAADHTPRLSAVIAAARRVKSRGEAADAAYYGYRGTSRHSRRRARRGVVAAPFPDRCAPWNIGTAAFSREVLGEMGGLLRPDIDLCAEVDLVLRASTYGAARRCCDVSIRTVVRATTKLVSSVTSIMIVTLIVSASLSEEPRPCGLSVSHSIGLTPSSSWPCSSCC
jgi:GT2 family glycosyltransferase